MGRRKQRGRASSTRKLKGTQEDEDVNGEEKLVKKPVGSVTIVLAISSTGERDRQTQEGDRAKGTQP